MANNCNCDYTQPSSYNVNQCVSCSSCSSNIKCSVEITQKRIWNQVRTPTSLYTMNVGSLTSAAERLQSAPLVNWNQRSDRQNASVQTAVHPSHGNSTKTSLTRERPGACAPGGTGVDKKHDSYARYLNRKKAGNLRTEPVNTRATKPLQGNKTYATNSVATSIDCNCKHIS
jgi:hypothetical protein